MKKLITILTIMIVLVGAVFATDPSAQITINASVSERVPSFKLTTTGNGSVLNSEATAIDYTSPAATTSVSIKTDIAEALADGTDQTVTFGIVLVPRNDGKKIKTDNTYTFTVTAGNLEHEHADTLGATADVDANERFVATADNFSVVLNQGNPVIPTTYATITAGATLQITFNNKSYDPGNAEFVFATFPVTYTGNDAAIPGNYSGTVTVELATT